MGLLGFMLHLRQDIIVIIEHPHVRTLRMMRRNGVITFQVTVTAHRLNMVDGFAQLIMMKRHTVTHPITAIQIVLILIQVIIQHRETTSITHHLVETTIK